MKRKYNVLMAREAALVDAQCLLQQALNTVYGNPRDCEEEHPKKAKKLFKRQRKLLAKRLKRSVRHVESLFDDGSNLRLKDLAEALNVLRFDLKLDIAVSRG